ncbi:heparinase II/III family protein [Paenibacillus hodogayensis]|uniref:Heparinase II/III family protein n=1 Tax=Paenibacillus hodogayensis TaxID=279208 RepID=A0ABV5VSM3_9BACL
MRNMAKPAMMLGAVDKGGPKAVVVGQTDRWSIIPRIGEAPAIDGNLDEAAWSEASRMSGFRAIYINEPVSPDMDTEVRFACDDYCLYIGIAGTGAVGARAAAERIDILLSAPQRSDRFFHIPLDISTGTREMNTVYGHGVAFLEHPERVRSALRRDSEGWTLEVAVPVSSVMDREPMPGDEWRINVIRCSGIAAPRPLSSLVPVRQSAIIDLGLPSSGYSVRVDMLPEGRMARLYWQRLPGKDEAARPEPWLPIWAELIYGGFTEKRLRLDAKEFGGCDLASAKLTWRTPSDERIDISELELDAADSTIAFRHPKPLKTGWYELQINITDRGGRQRLLVLSFDSHALIEAGESLYVPPPVAGVRIVVEEEPSEEVSRLLELIPPQPGFIFGGDPECPELYAGDKLFRWDPGDPFALVSPRTGTRHPNERFPEDKAFVVHNRKGEEVCVPYFEDADGRHYSLTGLLWYEQKIYALKQTSKLAKYDPLGAARLLNRWADAYAGWVPTNDYPWGCYPTEGHAGPPYHYWGGVWSRWSTSDLGELRHLAEAYAEVKKTNAFEVLSEETGFDVDRKMVEGMFRPSYAFFDSFSNGNHNNDYHNWIGLIALSRATGHPRYMHQALERIRLFVANRFLFDGFFGEVCVSYHLQSTGGLQATMEAAKGWTDPDGYVSPRSGQRADDLDLERDYPALQAFKRVIRGITYPNGHYFPIQDTWAFSISRSPDPNGASLFLPAAGIARLTLGSGEQQMQLYMSCVPKYGHDHLDPLNLALFACGQELLPDIGYTHTLYRQWTRSTMCHNTVVVDGKDMDRSSGVDGGSLRLFASAGADVQVMRMSQENAYPSLSEYGREAWLIGFGGDACGAEGNGRHGYVVDLFRIQGGTRHEYTLNGDANRDSIMETNVPMNPYGPYLLPPGTKVTPPTGELEQGDAQGHYYGYMYVQEVQRAEIGNSGYELMLRTSGEGRLKVIGLDGSNGNGERSELFLGKAPSLRSTRLHDKSKDNNVEAVRYSMPKLVVRKEGADLRSRFVHVMEPYAADGDPRIMRAELLRPERAGEGAVALAVAYGITTDIVLSSGSADLRQPLVVGDISLTGGIGFIRIENGEVAQMVLIGGTMLRKGELEIRGDGPTEGVIDSVLRKADGEPVDALVTSMSVPYDATRSCVIVTHPDGSTNGYPIRGIVREEGRTLLLVEGTDPGFTIREDGGSEMKFYPFKKWCGPHRFRIDNVVRLR